MKPLRHINRLHSRLRRLHRKKPPTDRQIARAFEIRMKLKGEI